MLETLLALYSVLVVLNFDYHVRTSVSGSKNLVIYCNKGFVTAFKGLYALIGNGLRPVLWEPVFEPGVTPTIWIPIDAQQVKEWNEYQHGSKGQGTIEFLLFLMFAGAVLLAVAVLVGFDPFASLFVAQPVVPSTEAWTLVCQVSGLFCH